MASYHSRDPDRAAPTGMKGYVFLLKPWYSNTRRCNSSSIAYLPLINSSDSQMPSRPVVYAPAGPRYPSAIPEHAGYREISQPHSTNNHGNHLASELESRIEAPHGSPPVNTFAFQAPRQSPPALYHQSEIELERHPSASTSYYADQPSTSTSTVSSSGLRPATMSTRRPSTGATSVAAYGINEATTHHKEDFEVACVKNLIGAVTTNGHKLKAPGESGLGIFFVFHDLRCVWPGCIDSSVEYTLISDVLFSVRTEGTFTIRLRLVSIGRCVRAISGDTACQSSLMNVVSPQTTVRHAYWHSTCLDGMPNASVRSNVCKEIPWDARSYSHVSSLRQARFADTNSECSPVSYSSLRYRSLFVYPGEAERCE